MSSKNPTNSDVLVACLVTGFITFFVTITLLAAILDPWEDKYLNPIYELTSFKDATCVEHGVFERVESTTCETYGWRQLSLVPNCTCTSEPCPKLGKCGCMCAGTTWQFVPLNVTFNANTQPMVPLFNCVDNTINVTADGCTLYRNPAGLTASPELAKRLGLEVSGG